MKKIFHLGLIALLAFSAPSCTKSDLLNNNGDPTPPGGDPGIVSKIYPNVNQPYAAELGNPATVFNTFDVVTIYLPHAMRQSDIQSATITLTDVATGLPVETLNLVPSTDPSAASLPLPYDLWYAPFMFITLTVDEEYTGKTISISTLLQGASSSSSDTIINAFAVQ